MHNISISIIVIIVLLRQRIDLAYASNKKDSKGAYFVILWITLIIAYFIGEGSDSVIRIILDAIIMLMSAESLFKFAVLSDGLEYEKIKHKTSRELKLRLKEMETDITILKYKKNRSDAAQKELDRLEEESEKLEGLIDWYESY